MKKQIVILLFGLAQAFATQFSFLPGLKKGQIPPGPFDSIPGYGYGVDSLLKDVAELALFEGVSVDSVGESVNGRPIWLVTFSPVGPPVTKSTSEDFISPGRIFIHARTHPREPQSSFIAAEMGRFLTSLDPSAVSLRQNFIVHMIPMLNPDGVEEGLFRHNANEIDLESNWNSQVLEPEVVVLKSLFDSLMALPNPIDVALNLHSDVYHCKRFFFFHSPLGTSHHFAELQKLFIDQVRSFFPGGIEPWNYVISWQNGYGAQYPEGYFWQNYREDVMALTFEDANCVSGGDYDITAKALLLGSEEFVYKKSSPVLFSKQLSEYSRPMRPYLKIPLKGRDARLRFDYLGRK